MYDVYELYKITCGIMLQITKHFIVTSASVAATPTKTQILSA